LKNLTVGDPVIVFFENKRYNYTVSKVQVMEAEDVSLLTDAQTGGQKLVLQTCWPPGTTWKRLVVIAEPK
jgi:LPXTG-site transpeptidase (sortase) family protein